MSARTCHRLRDIYSLLGHTEKSHSTWLGNGPSLRAQAQCPLMDIVPLATFFHSERPRARSCLSVGLSANQLQSTGTHRARERLQQCTAKGWDDLLYERRCAGSQVHDSCTLRGVAEVSLAPRLQLNTAAAAKGERLRSPSPAHTSIPGCSLWLRWGKGLGFVARSSRAAAHSSKPSRHVCTKDEPDTSEPVAER